MRKQNQFSSRSSLVIRFTRFAYVLGFALNLVSGQSAYSAAKDDDLFNAVKAGDLSTVQSLLKSGANVNARWHSIADDPADTEGWTPLMFAIDARQTEIAELLLKQRVDVNARVSNSTALILAASHGNYPLIELLVQKKANIRDKYAGDAIAAAIEGGHYEAVRTLLKLGVKHSLLDSDGRSPLNAAVHKEHKEILKLLLQSGADPNFCDKSTGYTSQCPLGNAAFKGNTETIEALIASKAKVDFTKGNENKWTPLMIAALADHVNAVKALIAAGAEVNYENEDAYSAVVYAASPETAQVLLDNGAVLSGGKAEQALRLAAVRGEINLVKLMLEKGANINHPDARAGFVWAAGAHRSDIVKTLIQAGVDVNARDDRQTALLAAVEHGLPLGETRVQAQNEVIRVLLAAGADVNALDFRGYTPLMVMFNPLLFRKECKRECLLIVQLLIAAKTDLNIKSQYGATALELARQLQSEEGREEVIRLLTAAGAK